MKKIIIALAILITLISCGDKVKKGLEDNLVVAINGNDIEGVKEVLEKEGVDLDFRLNKNVNQHNRTPLAWAAYTNYSTIEGIKEIELGTKADEDKKAGTGRVEIVKYLLEKGADCNITDDKNWTPLFWASWSGMDKVAALLIEKCTRVNDETRKQWTPLMAASMRGWHNVVELLLKKGADKSLKNDEGFTALDLAKKNAAIFPKHSERYEKTIALLKDSSSAADTKDVPEEESDVGHSDADDEINDDESTECDKDQDGNDSDEEI